MSTHVSIEKGRRLNSRTLHFVWIRKIFNHLHIGIITILASAQQPRLEVDYLRPLVNIGYEMSLYFNIYCNKYNAGNQHLNIFTRYGVQDRTQFL